MQIQITTTLDISADDMRRYTGDDMTDAEVIAHATDVARQAFAEAVAKSELAYFAWPVK